VDVLPAESFALSSCKAECYALSEACKHALYLNKFLGLLDLKPTIKLIKIYCNNTSVITLATTSEAVHNQVKHMRTKVAVGETASPTGERLWLLQLCHATKCPRRRRRKKPEKRS